MRCDEARQTLGPDPEAPSTSAELAEALRHYAGCPECRRFYLLHEALARHTRRLAAARQAPPALRAQLRDRLDREDARLRRRRRLPILAAGSSVMAAAAALLLFAVLPDSARRAAQPLAQEARIGLARPDAITSSDTAVLRRWLDVRVGYVVEIPAIADAELKGATLTQVDGVRGVAVVYEYHGMPLTYFDLPSDAPFSRWVPDGSVRSVADGGYELALWTDRGGARAVAAPMPRQELVRVANECRGKTGRGS
jgi:anti-sigma factor RsiW